MTTKCIRYAVIGLGYFAQASVLPAFARLRNSKLEAIVSGDRAKLDKVGDAYRVPHRVGYDELDALLRAGLVDAVYIVTPNSLHAEHAIRAARAGVHVLCEKPLAVTQQECSAIIEAAREAEVRLMVGYRLHFEPANLAAIQAIRSGRIGIPRCFDAVFTMQVRPGNVRLKADLGGGPLRDLGIYCVNAARYLFRDEPTEVIAFADRLPTDARFAEVDEHVSGMLRFSEGRLATFVAGFGAADVARCEVVGTSGTLRLDPAFHHAVPLKLEIKAEETIRRSYKKRDQIAAEIGYFSDCILERIDPEPSGIEGMADVRILEALELSIQRHAPVAVEPMRDDRDPDPSQKRYVAPHPMPHLVGASEPSR